MIERVESDKGFWRTRYTVILLCFAATFICYIDRVNISVAILPMAEELGWDTATQGAVLSSFYIGYLLMQIGGGRLADRFGGKLILGLGVVVWSIFTIITPFAAGAGLAALIVTRIGMGLGEAVTFPSVYSLVTRWFPDQEKSKAVALNASGIPIGTVFALIVTPIIVIELGWQWAFYLFGAVGLIWYFAWSRYVSNTPAQHPFISNQERSFLLENAQTAEENTNAPPIGQMLKNGPLWAITIAHFCSNWTLYVLLSWLPKYVSEGLGVPFAAVGIVAMLPHITSFICMNLAGSISDRLISSGMNVTKVRKLMQTISFGGLAICLALVPFVETVWAAIGLLCLSQLFLSANVGGFVVNHMDIAPNHAGTLMGITNTAGTIPGIAGVYITGLILAETGSWTMVFLVTAAVAIFGMLAYLFLASGEKQFD
jgi:ACS family sodium-dependent inorganic phosphate cotransporter